MLGADATMPEPMDETHRLRSAVDDPSDVPYGYCAGRSTEPPNTPLTTELPRTLRSAPRSAVADDLAPRMAAADDDSDHEMAATPPACDHAFVLPQVVRSYRLQLPGKPLQRAKLQELLPLGIVVGDQVASDALFIMKQMDRAEHTKKRQSQECHRDDLKAAVFRRCVRVTDCASMLYPAHHAELLEQYGSAVNRCDELIEEFVHLHGVTGRTGADDPLMMAGQCDILEELIASQQK